MKITTIASSSEGCCYLVETKTSRILIDCGVSIKKIKQALNFDLNIDACLISHEHGDHCKSARELEYLGVKVYCTKGTGKLKNLLNHTELFNKLIIRINDLKIIPVSMTHDCECYGFLIQSGDKLLLYATDTGELNYNIKGLTHLMIEANHSFERIIHSENRKRVSENHLSIEQCEDFISRHKELEEIHLLHLSDQNSNAQEFYHNIAKLSGIPVYVANK